MRTLHQNGRLCSVAALLLTACVAGVTQAGDWTVLETTKVDHTHGVQRIAISPDGKRLISADRTLLRLWDLSEATPKPLGSINGLKGMDFAGVRSLIYLPDGKTAATGVGGNTLRLLEVGGKDIAERLKFEDQAGNVQSLALSPDGKTLAAGSDDNTLLLYDLVGDTLKERTRIKPQKAGLGIKAIHFTPDGKTVILGYGGGQIRLWDLSGPEPREKAQAKINTGSFQVQSALSPDGKILAIAVEKNKAVELWDVSKGTFETVHKWSGIHQKEIGGIAWAPQGPIIAVADKDGRVVLYNTETREKVFDRQMSGHFENILFVPQAGKASAEKNLRLVVADWSNKGQIYLVSLGSSK